MCNKNQDYQDKHNQVENIIALSRAYQEEKEDALFNQLYVDDERYIQANNQKHRVDAELRQHGIDGA